MAFMCWPLCRTLHLTSTSICRGCGTKGFRCSRYDNCVHTSIYLFRIRITHPNILTWVRYPKEIFTKSFENAYTNKHIFIIINQHYLEQTKVNIDQAQWEEWLLTLMDDTLGEIDLDQWNTALIGAMTQQLTGLYSGRVCL